jgi:arsenate reductase
MQEVGIDISRQRPKAVADVPLGDIDTIVVLGCEEVGAVLPPLRRELWELPDPTRATGSEHDVETAFRQVRDELRRRIGELGR